MQRIEVLIDKLKDQYAASASPSQMLLTLQLLQAELQQLQMQGRGAMGGSKVAVVLPSAARYASAEVVGQHSNGASVAKAQTSKQSRSLEEDKHQPELFDVSDKPESVVELPNPAPARVPAARVEEPVKEKVVENEEILEEQEPVSEPLPSSPYDPLTEIPTLSHQQTIREINELVSESRESYNDRHNESRSELGDRLKDTPIKDLRKAIGLNDRYTFIAELFRGDEAMYERSIKTINSYHIFQEAEYWIHRELMVKLGWKENSPTVKHFYQLVKRRFA